MLKTGPNSNIQSGKELAAEIDRGKGDFAGGDISRPGRCGGRKQPSGKECCGLNIPTVAMGKLPKGQGCIHKSYSGSFMSKCSLYPSSHQV